MGHLTGTLERRVLGCPQNSHRGGTLAAIDAIDGESELRIDEYLRRRLMPVEGAIPHLPGIEMYGGSIPAGTVGGDVFEYLNFQQRYDIDARIARALRLSEEYLQPLPAGATPQNYTDVHVRWMLSTGTFTAEDIAAYRKAKSWEQLRIAENLKTLYLSAGVLLVDAQGHDLIAAKIASTVHDTFHAFMLSELDANGTITADLFEKLNLRLAHSVTARNALGRRTDAESREIATMVYGEILPSGHFRFVDFGHPPPLVFSAEYDRFMEIQRSGMVQFPALGLEIPEDHPDRNKYVSIGQRLRQIDFSDFSEITLMGSGDILFLYTDGVYDGGDVDDRKAIEAIVRTHKRESAKEICNAVLEHAVKRDTVLREQDLGDEVDDKTVLVIKKT
jgi:serine phosphatase RsbU (regulator of sigma subunit)